MLVTLEGYRVQYHLLKIKQQESEVVYGAKDSVTYDLIKTRSSKSSDGLRTATVIGWFVRFCLRLRQFSFHRIRSV